MAKTPHSAPPVSPHASMLRRYWPLAALCAILTVLVAAGSLGSEQLQVTLTEMLIRLIVVIGIYVFIGNAGILSFGHIGFMCIGAYAAAWATVDPTWKQMMLTGLPDFLQQNQYGFLPAVAGAGLLAGLVALIVGAAIMRLSGIAGSIATFALLGIVNSVYSNWESVTAATSSIIGVPAVVGPWVALAFAIGTLVVAYVFQVSRFGLMLRASRDDEVAAKSSAVSIVKMRLIAFVFSAVIVGVAGALYGHFLGILTADTFYLQMTFVTLAMLVVGGVGSLAGALTGVIAVTVIVEVLRHIEAGVPLGGMTLQIPQGSQEIGLGIAMALILIFRPTGLTKGSEIPYPFGGTAKRKRAK
jgi:branched-chain amino acid transport system permease protein